jgi:LmbE family N-acetylglucosaminyl deacetylase
MRFKSRAADLFVPDGSQPERALSRTTHLCIASHQDDIEIMAQHGISACFMRQDAWFSGVVVTDGAGSPRADLYAGFSDTQMRRVRAQEQRKAAFIGDYSIQIQLGYPSAEVKSPDGAGIVDDLLAILKAARPRVVYLHNPADQHDTHVAVLLRSLEAMLLMPPAHRPKQVLGCEVWRSLDWLVEGDKKVLPVSERPNLAASLLGVYDSQISGGKRYDLAAVGRSVANATYHKSHEPDRDSALVYALDLTPLLAVAPKDLDAAVSDLVCGCVDHLKAEIVSRLKNVSRNRRVSSDVQDHSCRQSAPPLYHLQSVVGDGLYLAGQVRPMKPLKG